MGSMAAAVQPNSLWNSQKTFYKTLSTSCSPQSVLCCPKRHGQRLREHGFSSTNLLPLIQGGWGGWPTGNGKKLSSSQAQLGQATCLAVSYFLSISCVPFTPSALYSDGKIVCGVQMLHREHKRYCITSSWRSGMIYAITRGQSSRFCQNLSLHCTGRLLLQLFFPGKKNIARETS